MKKNKILDQLFSPVGMGLVVAVIALILMLGLKLVKIMHIMSVDERVHWVLGAMVLMFYGMTNAVNTLQHKGDMNKYWFTSTLTYIGVALTVSGFAYLFSGTPIDEAGTIKWIYFVITFGYLTVLSIMRFMKKIVEIAQREDDKWLERARKGKK